MALCFLIPGRNLPSFLRQAGPKLCVNDCRARTLWTSRLLSSLLRLKSRVPELYHPQCRLENASLYDLDLAVESDEVCIPTARELLIHLLQSGSQFSPDASPFRGLEVVVLEDDHQW